MSIGQVIRLLEHYKKIYGDLPCDIHMDGINHKNNCTHSVNSVVEHFDEEHNVESICLMCENNKEGINV